MPARRIFAWLIYAALTAPIGLFAHFAFEAYCRRDGGFSPFEPDHLAWLTVVFGAIAAVVFALRRGTRDERRERLAVLRASVPRGIGLVVATGTVQLSLAGITLALEDLAFDPTRAAFAAVLAIATALAGAVVFLCAEDVVLTSAAGLGYAWAAPGRKSSPLGFAFEIYGAGRIAIRLQRGRSPPFRP
jgi:hypothetical protein